MSSNSASAVWDTGRRSGNSSPGESLRHRNNPGNSDETATQSSNDPFRNHVDSVGLPNEDIPLFLPTPTRLRVTGIWHPPSPPPSDKNDDDAVYIGEFHPDSEPNPTENPLEKTTSTSDEQPRYVYENRAGLPSPPVESDNGFADNEIVQSDGDSQNSEPTARRRREHVFNLGVGVHHKKGFCLQCGYKTMLNCFYCIMCFRATRNWLPSRPASRRLKAKKANIGKLQNTAHSSREAAYPTQGGVVIDGERPSSSSHIQPTLRSPQPRDMNSGLVVDENEPCAHRSTAPDAQPGLTPTETVCSALSSQCSVCFSRLKDAAFVHDKCAHLYSCYPCANKILKKQGKCPICRKRISRVVKVIA